jgi:hypothetical protein
MAQDVDRDQIIAWLDRLGSEADAEVLEAARALHAHVTEAGASWDDLLADEAGGLPELDVEEEEVEEAVAAKPAASGRAPKTNEDATRLIDRMLRDLNLSAETRQELQGYKEDIVEGEFDERDRAYLQALNDRLRSKR